MNRDYPLDFMICKSCGAGMIKMDNGWICSDPHCEDGSIIEDKRATKHSAGYDFFSPIDFTLSPNETIIIPTGIKVQLDEDKYLAIYPRSSLGIRYRLQLDNTVGVIDSDYYNNKDNEGHIFIKFTNLGDKALRIKQGDAIAQGIISQYFIVSDDDSTEMRTGGIGSTGN